MKEIPESIQGYTLSEKANTRLPIWVKIDKSSNPNKEGE